MTGGQTKLNLAGKQSSDNMQFNEDDKRAIDRSALTFKVIQATADELEQHETRLDVVEKDGGSCLWRSQPN